MGARFATLYFRWSAARSLHDLVNTLSVAQLSLEHPEGRGVLWLDEIGDHHPITISALGQMVASGADTVFQFWYPSGMDVVCRTRRTGSRQIIEMNFEGTSEAERRSLFQSLLRSSLCLQDPPFGLVFDEIGYTEEYDWDRFFVEDELLTDEAFIEGTPELVLFDRALATKVQVGRYVPEGGLLRLL